MGTSFLHHEDLWREDTTSWFTSSWFLYKNLPVMVEHVFLLEQTLLVSDINNQTYIITFQDIQPIPSVDRYVRVGKRSCYISQNGGRSYKKGLISSKLSCHYVKVQGNWVYDEDIAKDVFNIEQVVNKHQTNISNSVWEQTIRSIMQGSSEHYEEVELNTWFKNYQICDGRLTEHCQILSKDLSINSATLLNTVLTFIEYQGKLVGYVPYCSNIIKVKTRNKTIISHIKQRIIDAEIHYE